MGKYNMMGKMKLPQGAIIQKMTADGISQSDQDAFLAGGGASGEYVGAAGAPASAPSTPVRKVKPKTKVRPSLRPISGVPARPRLSSTGQSTGSTVGDSANIEPALSTASMTEIQDSVATEPATATSRESLSLKDSVKSMFRSKSKTKSKGDEEGRMSESLPAAGSEKGGKSMGSRMSKSIGKVMGVLKLSGKSDKGGKGDAVAWPAAPAPAADPTGPTEAHGSASVPASAPGLVDVVETGSQSSIEPLTQTRLASIMEKQQRRGSVSLRELRASISACNAMRQSQRESVAGANDAGADTPVSAPTKDLEEVEREAAEQAERERAKLALSRGEDLTVRKLKKTNSMYTATPAAAPVAIKRVAAPAITKLSGTRALFNPIETDAASSEEEEVHVNIPYLRQQRDQRLAEKKAAHIDSYEITADVLALTSQFCLNYEVEDAVEEDEEKIPPPPPVEDVEQEFVTLSARSLERHSPGRGPGGRTRVAAGGLGRATPTTAGTGSASAHTDAEDDSSVGSSRQSSRAGSPLTIDQLASSETSSTTTPPRSALRQSGRSGAADGAPTSSQHAATKTHLLTDSMQKDWESRHQNDELEYDQLVASLVAYSMGVTEEVISLEMDRSRAVHDTQRGREVRGSVLNTPGEPTADRIARHMLEKNRQQAEDQAAKVSERKRRQSVFSMPFSSAGAVSVADPASEVARTGIVRSNPTNKSTAETMYTSMAGMDTVHKEMEKFGVQMAGPEHAQLAKLKRAQGHGDKSTIEYLNAVRAAHLQASGPKKSPVRNTLWRSAVTEADIPQSSDPRFVQQKARAKKLGERLLSKEFGREFANKDEWEGILISSDVVRRRERQEKKLDVVRQAL